MELRCRYCFYNSTDLKLIQLRYNNKYPWQHPMLVCKSCRKHLRGKFKYFISKQKGG